MWDQSPNDEIDLANRNLAAGQRYSRNFGARERVSLPNLKSGLAKWY
jgi:hypothetical protein